MTTLEAARKRLRELSRDLPTPRFEDEPTCYRVLDAATGAIEIDHESPVYESYKRTLGWIGIDINAIKTEEEFESLTSSERYIRTAATFRRARWAALSPKNLEEAMVKALMREDYDEVVRLAELIDKKRKSGLHIVR